MLIREYEKSVIIKSKWMQKNNFFEFRNIF